MNQRKLNSICCGLWITVLFLTIVGQFNGEQPDYFDVYLPLVVVIINCFERATRP
jgi:hypothetical protein